MIENGFFSVCPAAFASIKTFAIISSTLSLNTAFR